MDGMGLALLRDSGNDDDKPSPRLLTDGQSYHVSILSTSRRSAQPDKEMDDASLRLCSELALTVTVERESL